MRLKPDQRGLHTILSVALSCKQQGRKESRAQWWQDSQGSVQLSTCKYNTIAKTCGSCKQQHSDASLAPCPEKQTVGSVLPYADLFHQPAPSRLLGSSLSVIGVLITTLLNPPRSEPKPAGEGPHSFFSSHFQTHRFFACKRDMQATANETRALSRL